MFPQRIFKKVSNNCGSDRFVLVMVWHAGVSPAASGLTCRREYLCVAGETPAYPTTILSIETCRDCLSCLESVEISENYREQFFDSFQNLVPLVFSFLFISASTTKMSPPRRTFFTSRLIQVTCLYPMWGTPLWEYRQNLLRKSGQEVELVVVLISPDKACAAVTTTKNPLDVKEDTSSDGIKTK